MEWTLLWVSALSNCKQYELEKHSLTLSYCPLTDSVITSQFQSLFCASLVKKKKIDVILRWKPGHFGVCLLYNIAAYLWANLSSKTTFKKGSGA